MILLIVESFFDYNVSDFYINCVFTKSQDIEYYEGKPYHKFFMDI